MRSVLPAKSPDYRGSAQRLLVADVGELAAVIEKIRPDQALALGALRADLPEKVHVVTKSKLNGQPNTIARTAANIHFRKERPAYALIDFDTKGMPAEVAERMQQLGGFWPSLVSVLPILESTEHVIRRSTSTGLYRTDTGKTLPGSGGLHSYLKVVDGADIERFCATLHDRCWLAGFGWMMVGAGGQLLERSHRRPHGRRARAPGVRGRSDPRSAAGAGPGKPPPDGVDGAALDTTHRLSTAHHRRDSEAARPQGEGRRIVSRRNRPRRARHSSPCRPSAWRSARASSEAAAPEQIARQCDGVLLPDVVLPFDDEELSRLHGRPTCSPIPRASREPPSPTRSRASITVMHAPASCAAPTAHRGFIHSPTAAPSTS